MIELRVVTRHTKDEYNRVWDELAQDPTDQDSWGPWSSFGTDEVKDTWNRVLFLIRETGRVLSDGDVDVAIPDENVGVAWIERHHADRRCDFGLGLLPEFRGKRAGTQSTWKLIDYCFERFGVEKVTSHGYASNPASLKMQEGNMVQEGLLRRQTYLHGRYVDQVLFGLLREEWIGQVAKRRVAR